MGHNTPRVPLASILRAWQAIAEPKFQDEARTSLLPMKSQQDTYVEGVVPRTLPAAIAAGSLNQLVATGNPHGNRHRTRHLLNQEFMQALLLNFRHQGKKAIEKVARNQPGVYLKILALLVPREMQIEHTNRIKQMTDEEIEQAIEAIQTMLAARAGEAVKVIEGTAEPAALVGRQHLSDRMS